MNNYQDYSYKGNPRVNIYPHISWPIENCGFIAVPSFTCKRQVAITTGYTAMLPYSSGQDKPKDIT
jgi:hypothetical protein